MKKNRFHQSFVDYKKYWILILSLAAGQLVFWTCAFFSRGETLLDYFVYAEKASLMDFFSPIIKEIDNTYVDPYYSKYPPLANVFFLFVRRFIPQESLTDIHTIRSAMSANVGLVIMLLSNFLLLYEMMKRCLVNIEKEFLKKFTVIFILISGPFLFCYERANIILITFVLTLFFVMFYENENKYLRELALIALAIAAAIKIYPALFGVLLLKRGNLKVAARTILYGVFITFLPFVVYDGGRSLIAFVVNITSSNVDLTLSNFPHCFSFSGFVFIIYRLFFNTSLSSLPMGINLVPILLCGLIFLFGKEKWKKYLSITLLVVWLPTLNFTYTLCYFMIPLLAFLKEDKKTRVDWIYLLCFIMILLPYPFPVIDSVPEQNYFLPLGTVITNSAMCIMAITASLESIITKVKRNEGDRVL